MLTQHLLVYCMFTCFVISSEHKHGTWSIIHVIYTGKIMYKLLEVYMRMFSDNIHGVEIR